MPAQAEFGAIERQILWNRLIGLVEEQAQTLIRAAFSQAVRESGDLSAGVFDRRGAMVAQAITGTPGHVNSMAVSVVHFLAKYPIDSMRPGDAYLYDIGVLHSPERKGPTKLIRIEGLNMSRIKRKPYVAVEAAGAAE